MNDEFLFETQPFEGDLEHQNLGRSGRWVQQGRTWPLSRFELSP
jgi:hypothetical protein